MNDFYLWFSTGLEHIADWKGYDHILFITALCGVYSFRDWKQLLVLVTAFTLGHSITLALSVLDIITIPGAYIEFLIPVTILITCVFNLSQLDRVSAHAFRMRYVSALVFGLIHGMGFSYLLKSLLGTEGQVMFPLFAFNIGLEAGQLLILAVVLLLNAIARNLLKSTIRDQRFFISAAVFGIAFMLLLQRIP